MSLIMLIAGATLFFMGRIELGTFRAAGKHVKAAGLILTLPAVITFLLSDLFIPLAFGSNVDAAASVRGFIAILQLIGMMVAIALAYVLIAAPPGAPRLPGILGEIQDEAQADQSSSPTPRRGKIIDIPSSTTGFRPRINPNRDNFPSVMSLKEAARYLQITEDDVLQLIDEGKISAARDNYNYKIAKSQLDELL